MQLMPRDPVDVECHHDGSALANHSGLLSSSSVSMSAHRQGLVMLGGERLQQIAFLRCDPSLLGTSLLELPLATAFPGGEVHFKVVVQGGLINEYKDSPISFRVQQIYAQYRPLSSNIQWRSYAFISFVTFWHISGLLHKALFLASSPPTMTIVSSFDIGMPLPTSACWTSKLVSLLPCVAHVLS